MTDRLSTLRFVFLGLSITSSWGNGHATTYRGLLRALAERGHEVLFLERDMPWYAANRDLGGWGNGDGLYQIELYSSLEDLALRFTDAVRSADMVIVGSYVPEGVLVGEWVISTARGRTAFYDIDTPVTLRKLVCNDYEYLAPDQIGRYGMYLSFTGGPTLTRLETEYGARKALPLYCAVDPALYYPEALEPNKSRYDLTYMGTYSPDRQPTLERLLLQPAQRLPARRFAVAGPLYPADIAWPENVTRIEHLPPSRHRAFYNASRYTLNITRRDMQEAGYSPSVRLFEAAACGAPIISDRWPGVEYFFRVGTEILVANDAEDVLGALEWPETEAPLLEGEAARQRVLNEHTAAHRAETLEAYARGAW